MNSFWTYAQTWPSGFDLDFMYEWLQASFPLRSFLLTLFLAGYVFLLRFLLSFIGDLDFAIVRVVRSITESYIDVGVATLFILFFWMAPMFLEYLHWGDFRGVVSFNIVTAIPLILFFIVAKLLQLVALIFTPIMAILLYFFMPVWMIALLVPLPFLIYALAAGLHFHTVAHPVRKHIDSEGNVDHVAAADTMEKSIGEKDIAFGHENQKRHAEIITTEQRFYEERHTAQQQRYAQTRKYKANAALAKQVLKTSIAKERAQAAREGQLAFETAVAKRLENGEKNTEDTLKAIDLQHGEENKKLEQPKSVPVVCTECDGLGAIRGTQRIDCVLCAGSGKESRGTCSRCNGSGKIAIHPCIICDGKGVVDAQLRKN